VVRHGVGRLTGCAPATPVPLVSPAPLATTAASAPTRSSSRLSAVCNAYPPFVKEGDWMKITDLTCATLGHNLIVCVATDEGISGYGEIEAYKAYLKPQVLHYTPYILAKIQLMSSACCSRFATGGVQALGQRRERDRDGAVGHCRQGRGPTRVHVAGGQSPRPGTRLQWGRAVSVGRSFSGGVCGEHGANEGIQGRVHHYQAGHRLPWRDGARGPRVLLWGPGRRRPRDLRSWPVNRARPPARHRVRRGDEDRARRRRRSRAGLWARVDGARRHPPGAGAGTARCMCSGSKT